MPEDVKEKSEVNDISSVKTVKPASSGNMTATLTKFAMIGIVVLVAVFAAYIITLKVLKPMMAQSPPPQVTQEEMESGSNDGAEESGGHGGGSDGGGHGEEAAGDKDTQFYTIESIVVNPAGTAGTRFLSCSVSFEVFEKDDIKTYEALEIRLKDVLITILSSKTVEELSDIKSRNRMRREILLVVNRLTKPAKAKAVYLTDFVLQ